MILLCVECLKEQRLFKIEIFCCIINPFTVNLLDLVHPCQIKV